MLRLSLLLLLLLLFDVVLFDDDDETVPLCDKREELLKAERLESLRGIL